MILMGLYEFLQVLIRLYKYLWVFIRPYAFFWVFMGPYRLLFFLTDSNGSLYVLMGLHEFL